MGFMGEIGLEKGKGSPCVFVHRKRDLIWVIHGNDFSILGWQEHLDRFWNQAQNNFEANHRARLGPDIGDEKQVRILNQIVTWTEDGIEYEGDQRHADICISNFGLASDSRSVNTPVDKAIRIGESDDDWLDKSESIWYRGITARMNYLPQDRSDIQFAIKEVSHAMASPRISDMKKAKGPMR